MNIKQGKSENVETFIIENKKDFFICYHWKKPTKNVDIKLRKVIIDNKEQLEISMSDKLINLILNDYEQQKHLSNSNNDNLIVMINKIAHKHGLSMNYVKIILKNRGLI